MPTLLFKFTSKPHYGSPTISLNGESCGSIDASYAWGHGGYALSICKIELKPHEKSFFLECEQRAKTTEFRIEVDLIYRSNTKERRGELRPST